MSAGAALSFTISALLDACAVVTHVALLVISTLTTSPCLSVLATYVSLLVPAGRPLILHWYEGAVPPFKGVAVKVTSEPSHEELYNGLMDTAGVTMSAVIVISLLVAIGVVVQPALLVITTVIISPSLSVLLENVLLFVPTIVPFTFHWYEGLVPPFTGIAVKRMVAPLHNEVDVDRIVTDGVTSSSSSVIVLLFTTGITAQAALLVSVTETISPAFSVLLENVLLLVPTIAPFNFHWKIGLAPSLMVVAVNMIVDPLHTEVELAVMLTSGSISGLTTIVTGLIAEHPDTEVALI